LAVSPSVVPVVVDCSVIAKWELPSEEYTPEAMELFRDWGAGTVAVHSPDLLLSEIGSVFLRSVRRGRITEAEARVSIRNLLNLNYVLHDSRLLVPHAFEIAYQLNQRIYDCFYVAMAEREGMNFWTSDERFYNALNAHFSCVRLIAHYTAQRRPPSP
jgi:predicted nucleic acid-binding protein